MIIDYYYALIALLLCSSSIIAAEQNSTCARYGFDVDNLGTSCTDIYDTNPASHGKSDYYVIKTDHMHTVYCDMELQCGGHKGGWMKIADYDISRGDDCPNGWSKTTANNIDMCRSPSNSAGCYSSNFLVNKVNYSKICGKVKGYQKGSPSAFAEVSNSSLNNEYVEGISITLGNPRKHVWTYAVGLSDDGNYGSGAHNCPCAVNQGRAPPSFVGSHYYCESGNTGGFVNSQYHTEDPLWDGAGCSANNNCCTNTDQPWFFRQLVTSSQDYIEARLCTNQGFADEAVLVEQIQLYVQ